MAVEIHGFCAPRFAPLQDAFAANFEAGREIGASLGVTFQGEMVVDLWAGHADPEQTRLWGQDTLIGVYSTTKMSAILSALLLVDRGQLDLDASVTRYWPEFAAGGKAAVTVRQALTHQAGVPGFDPPITLEVMRDWEAVTARLAAEPHWFGGTPRLCYHYGTYGFLIGEIIRRVDGRGPRQFFAEEFAGPLGWDIHIGLADPSDFERIAAEQWTEVGMADLHIDPLVTRMVQSTPMGVEATWEKAHTEDPGGNGYANGRSIAQLCSLVAMGGQLGGVRYLSEAILAEAGREQVFGNDPRAGPLSMGLGFGRHHAEHFPHLSAAGLGWGGIGGSVGLADPAFGVSLGYAPNHMILEPSPMGERQAPIITALEAVVGIR